MVELFKKLNEKASEIVSLKLADLIDDVDLLTVALCAGNLSEIVRTIHTAREGECDHEAAHAALDLGWNPSLREAKARDGFFAKGLCGLMDLSKQHPDTGTRLMPILGEMVSDCKKYGISEKLKCETTCYMYHIRQRDGFAITYIGDDGKVIIKPAPGLLDD